MVIVTTGDLKASIFSNENSLKQEAADVFNAALINSSYETIGSDKTGEYIIEVGQYKFMKVLKEVVEEIKQRGWKVRDGYYYSLKYACPSWAIFIDAAQVEEAKK